MAEEVRRGDLWWVDWEPGRGSEQRGRRPALVLQNDIGNTHSPTTIVASVTSRGPRRFPILVLVPVSAAESGLPRDSFVNLTHILTIDKRRLLRRCGRLSAERLLEVDRALKISLGILR
jgi:mRNA interferase MazF